MVSRERDYGQVAHCSPTTHLLLHAFLQLQRPFFVHTIHPLDDTADDSVHRAVVRLGGGHELVEAAGEARGLLH